MATYFKRGKTWSTKVRWYDDDGKRHSKSKSGFSTKLLAKQWAVDQESKLNKGVQIAKEISLVDYYNNWVNTYKKDKLSTTGLTPIRKINYQQLRLTVISILAKHSKTSFMMKR